MPICSDQSSNFENLKIDYGVIILFFSGTYAGEIEFS